MDASRNLFCGMQREAHGAQQPSVAIPAPGAYALRVMATGENASTAQRSAAPAKWTYGGIL